eukprot:46323-Prymnesium_polylepis.1
MLNTNSRTRLHDSSLVIPADRVDIHRCVLLCVAAARGRRRRQKTARRKKDRVRLADRTTGSRSRIAHLSDGPQFCMPQAPEAAGQPT